VLSAPYVLPDLCTVKQYKRHGSQVVGNGNHIKNARRTVLKARGKRATVENFLPAHNKRNINDQPGLI